MSKWSDFDAELDTFASLKSGAMVAWRWCVCVRVRVRVCECMYVDDLLLMMRSSSDGVLDSA